MTDFPPDDLVKRQDVIDRLRALLAIYEKERGDAEDALEDMLDCLHGWCSPSFRVPSADDNS